MATMKRWEEMAEYKLINDKKFRPSNRKKKRPDKMNGPAYSCFS